MNGSENEVEVPVPAPVTAATPILYSVLYGKPVITHEVFGAATVHPYEVAVPFDV